MITDPNPTPAVGDRVRVQRDEARHPSRGTWIRYRGKTGTVVEVNRDRRRPHLTEYGVVFGTVRRPDRHGSIATGGSTWFKAYELTPLMAGAASERLQSATSTPSRMGHTREAAA